MMKEMPSDPGAHARLSTEELERKVEELSKLSPEELEEVIRKLESDEEESSRVLADDSIYQMDVSLKPRASGAVRVFWKDVDVEEVKDYPGWYCVTVDGRKVKAFESSNILAVPSEAMALCCAQEYAEQTGYINKLLMPMSDMCSGALHVAPQMIPPRIDYLMTFFQNDNLYFRSAAIADEQDRMIQPIVDWFEATYDIAVPRIVGIGYPNITPHAVQKMRQHLLSLAMNPYQVVAFCVAAQFTSSLLLPLAMFNGVVDLPTGLRINRAEELHNINEAGMIEGYHDIREADAVTKICACVTSWKIMKDVPLSKCLEVPRASGDLDDVDAA
ncbi:ATP synthase mitochondrial F1 complex assembly factor 2 [Angomonas deanei]|nr:ATP synthase mitochondrial F1 complex assembly factor 2 [Angomonas deanei]|eukprot:EPY37355.1 ATP synthase mitochondrial F1 complex assembly factor 2 [Angomonas deanei]